MKKMLLMLGGFFLVGTVPATTIACSLHVGSNDFKSSLPFNSTAQLSNDDKDVIIDFTYDNIKHHLEVLSSVSSTAVEKAKKFYWPSNFSDSNIDKAISHIKYSFEIKKNGDQTIELVKSIDTLE